MGNLAQVQTSEIVSTVATPATIPNTLAVTEPIDQPFNNYRSFTVPNVASVFTPDLSKGSGQFITGIAGAFTIANPINPPAQNANSGMEMVVCIINSSGGALGAITADTQYKLVGGAFPIVANGTRVYIAFTNIGTQAAPVWSETGRGAGTAN
jgi:hypothetical protein